MDSREQFSIPFKGIVNKNFWDKGDFAKFSREHRNTDPLGPSHFLQATTYLMPPKIFSGSDPD